MAPETLRSEFGPASDAWAAGVMAYELLSGKMPFDDPSQTDLAILRAVLTKKVDLSPLDDPAEADFVSRLLTRSVSDRMTIDGALEHPFLC